MCEQQQGGPASEGALEQREWEGRVSNAEETQEQATFKSGFEYDCEDLSFCSERGREPFQEDVQV